MSNINSSEQELNAFTKFLYWLSTADYELIKTCKVDRGRYRVIGYSVMATWLFATGCWMYFFSTVTSSPFAYIFLGIFMGFIILCIDRALISGINRKNKTRITSLVFRCLLALVIGTFMAQPAILFLFQKDIQIQVAADKEQKLKENRLAINNTYKTDLDNVDKEKTGIEKILANKNTEVEIARKNYLAETDGSGGSGKVGISNIALAKKAELTKLEKENKELETLYRPQLNTINNKTLALDSSIQLQQKNFAALPSNGFLTQINALQNLLKSNTALAFRYYLLVLLIVLIEVMPVIVKSILPAGAYDEKLYLQEQLEKDLMLKQFELQKEQAEYFSTQSVSMNKKTIDDFFAKDIQKRKEKINEPESEFVLNGLKSKKNWQYVKNELLSEVNYD